METIIFYDQETNEEITFEVIDQLKDAGNDYLLVADEADEALILKAVSEENDEVTYALIEDADEYQRVTLLFLESDEYDIEV